MTAVIADTDILSTFGKVNGIGPLHQLFEIIYIAPAVYRELLQVERLGFAWISHITPIVNTLPLTIDDNRVFEQLVRQHPQLGSGEVESFVLAERHHLLCLTNDRRARHIAHGMGLACLDLEEILRALKIKGLLTTDELTVLIEQIEREDRTRIKAKEDILKS